MVTMGSNEKFRYCLQQTLIPMFKWISIDAAKGEKLNRFGYFAILGYIIISIIAVLNGTFFMGGGGADPTVILLGGCTLAGIAQNASKYIFLKDVRTFVEVANFVLEIYDANRLNPLCGKFAVMTEKIIKIISAFYIFIAAAITAYIGVCAKFSGNMALPMIYPGIDIGEIEGFILNAILQVTMLVVVLGCNLLFDALVTVVFVNMSMVSQFLTEKIDALQELLREEKLDAPAGREKMLAIISFHIEYNRAIHNIQQAFLNLCSVGISTAFIVTVFGFGGAVTNASGNPMTYITTSVGLFQVTLFCTLGALIDSLNRNICATIQCFEWNLLPRRNAFIYRMLLHHAQQPQKIYMLGVWELNMERYVSILQKIYSYVTILRAYYW